MDPETSRRGGTLEVIQQMYRTKVIYYLPVLLFSVMGLAVAAPFLPNELTNFFASRGKEEYIRCETYALGTAPTECNDAHGEAAMWQSWSSFVSSSVVSFIVSPIIGAASDKYGRKPFVVLSILMQILPMLAIVFYTNLQLISLLWYFPVHALCGGFNSMSVTLAAVADALPPQNRSIGFGMVLASVASGFILGPLAGTLMPDMTFAFFTSILALLVSFVFSIIFLKETLPQPKEEECDGSQDLDLEVSEMASKLPKELQERQRSSACSQLLDSVSSLAILNRSPLFRRLTLLIIFTSMCQGGLQEFLFQYLQITLNFQQRDQAEVIMIIGIGGVLVQMVLLGPIMKALGEKKTLVLGLVVSMMYYVGLAMALSKAEVLGVMCLGTLGMVTFPAISSLKSNNVAASEQGRIQGAIVGIQALATGVGPLAFSALFAFFTRSGSAYYLPQAPFIFAIFLLLCAVILAIAVCYLVDQSDGIYVKVDVDASEKLVGQPQKSNKSGVDECIHEPLLSVQRSSLSCSHQTLQIKAETAPSRRRSYRGFDDED